MPSPMANPKVLVGPRDGRSSHHDLPRSRRSPCLVPPVVCPPSHLSPVGASSLFHPLMRRSKQSNSQRGPATKREPSEGSSTAQDRGSVILDSRPKMSGVEPQVEIEWMIGVVPALLGLYAITKLTNHTDGLLPFWQGVSPIMQSHIGMELVAEPPQEF